MGVRRVPARVVSATFRKIFGFRGWVGVGGGGGGHDSVLVDFFKATMRKAEAVALKTRVVPYVIEPVMGPLYMEPLF